MIILVNNTSAKAHYFVNKVHNYEDEENLRLNIKNLPFPSNSAYAVKRV